MKKASYIKGALLQVTFVATILLSASCGFNQKPEDTKQKDDAHFLVNAAKINLEQIQFGQLAQQRGRTTHIKELGKMMKSAHTKSLTDLRALAKSKMISIPTAPTDNTLDMYKVLNGKSKNDFDKAYADKMVSKHKDAIDTFEKATTDSYDTDIKNWAIATLPNLRTKLNHSIDCQKKCNELYSK